MAGAAKAGGDRERILRAREAVDLVDLVRRDTELTGSHGAGRFRGCCPLHGGSNRTAFTVSWSQGEGCWRFACYSCDAHGDVLDYLAASRGLPVAEAVEWCIGAPERRAHTPVTAARRPKAPARDRKRDSRVRASRIWHAARPATGTIAGTYFETRGLDPAWLASPNFRFAPALKFWSEPLRDFDPPRLVHVGPALVSRVENREGAGIAVHCTYLAPDGAGKLAMVDPDTGEDLTPKKMHGEPLGGILMLTPRRAAMLCGEGIESTGSILRVAWGDGCEGASIFGEPVGAFATLSLSNFAGAGAKRTLGPKRPSGEGHLPTDRPDPTGFGFFLPEGVRRVFPIRDSDSAAKDRAAHVQLFRRACHRAAHLGARVTPIEPPDGLDANDWLLGKGGHEPIAGEDGEIAA